LSEYFYKPTYVVHLSAAQKTSEPASVTARFGFAPDQPTVGQPGKDAGDMIFRNVGNNAFEVLVSLGKASHYSLEMVRRAGGRLGAWLVDSGSSALAVDLPALEAFPAPHATADQVAQALFEGIKLGAYQFNQYKKDPEPIREFTVTALSSQPAVTQALLERVEKLTNAILFARDLSHQPANVINPITLAEQAQLMAAQFGLKVRVLDDKELAQLGAGAILAVGQGSQTPSRLIVLEYPGTQPELKPVVLVGKAITFDTGGYSLKSTDGMVSMKYDKCGGADVLATLQAAAALRLKTPLIGIVGAAENMISGGSYRPDDIIKTLNGKTVEIVSTDAEGRLVLADALAYAQKEYQPRAIIDLATLTGGVVNALGHVRAGLMSNNDALAETLSRCGDRTFERLWRMPLDEEFSKKMKGVDADLRNSGGREGHCILGGAFLKEFVSDDVPWAHLDIAGMADLDHDLPYSPKGATGFGIRLLIDYLENLA
jgi:leucyl aminopeptidase